MQKYLDGQAIDFTVPLLDAQGDSAIVSKVTWELLNESESSVTSGELTPEIDAITAEINLDASFCAITNGHTTEARMLKVTLEIESGDVTNNEVFLLEKSQTVIPAVNSFVTYLQALRLMPEFPQFTAMNNAAESDRKSALIAAYRNIGNIEFSAGSLIDDEREPFLNELGEKFWSTLQLTPDLYVALDSSIKQNLEYAQMAEAEAVLGGDGTEELRSKGVMSYTVGEVKQFFRTSKPLDLCVSKHSLKYIGRYVQYNRAISRV